LITVTVLTKIINVLTVNLARNINSNYFRKTDHQIKLYLQALGTNPGRLSAPTHALNPYMFLRWPQSLPI
jgi:hypothetical protein